MLLPGLSDTGLQVIDDSRSVMREYDTICHGLWVQGGSRQMWFIGQSGPTGRAAGSTEFVHRRVTCKGILGSFCVR